MSHIDCRVAMTKPKALAFISVTPALIGNGRSLRSTSSTFGVYRKLPHAVCGRGSESLARRASGSKRISHAATPDKYFCTSCLEAIPVLHAAMSGSKHIARRYREVSSLRFSLEPEVYLRLRFPKPWSAPMRSKMQTSAFPLALLVSNGLGAPSPWN